MRFDLPQAVEDALAKGIPMYFVAEATIYRDRWYWYDKRVAFAARHMRLVLPAAHAPLAPAGLVQPIGNSAWSLGQIFDSREEALAAVQRISRWQIADAATIDPDATHNIDFRFRLDVSQLPRPFQIGAVGQADWNILAVRNQRLRLRPRPVNLTRSPEGPPRKLIESSKALALGRCRRRRRGRSASASC